MWATSSATADPTALIILSIQIALTVVPTAPATARPKRLARTTAALAATAVRAIPPVIIIAARKCPVATEPPKWTVAGARGALVPFLAAAARKLEPALIRRPPAAGPAVPVQVRNPATPKLVSCRLSLILKLIRTAPLGRWRLVMVLTPWFREPLCVLIGIIKMPPIVPLLTGQDLPMTPVAVPANKSIATSLMV